MSRYYAVIDPASPRHAAWIRSFGSDAVPIRSPTPRLSHFFDEPERPAEWVYLADLAALDAHQVDGLCRHLAADSGASATEVFLDITTAGLPLLVDAVIVTTDPDQARAEFRRRAEVLKGGGA